MVVLHLIHSSVPITAHLRTTFWCGICSLPVSSPPPPVAPSFSPGCCFRSVPPPDQKDRGSVANVNNGTPGIGLGLTGQQPSLTGPRQIYSLNSVEGLSPASLAQPLPCLQMGEGRI